VKSETTIERDVMLNRRELLQRVAVLLGSALSAPAALGVLNGHSATSAKDYAPRFLTVEELALVAVVADIMLPRTDTPGANDVGVPAFIDTLLADVYQPADKERYRTGLRAFDAMAKETRGQAFTMLSANIQQMLVQQAHTSEIAAHTTDRPFMLMTKELTLLGFFTSEIGATQVLQYEAIPGAFQACVPVGRAGNGKAWATEMSLPF
jgi:hypothetical protein